MRKTPARTPAATTPAASARPSITGGRLGRPSPPSPSSYYSSYYTAGYFEERPSILALYLVIFLTTLIIGGLVTALFFAYARELAHPRVTKATTTKTTTNNTRAQAQTSVASALPASTAKAMRPARRGNVEVTSNSPLPKASKRSSKNRRKGRRKSTSSKRAKQNATTASERARRGKGMTAAFRGSDYPLDKSAANRIGHDAETGPTERSSGIMPVQPTADTSGTIDTTISAPGPATVTTMPLKWAGLLYSVPTADETNATGPSLSYNPDQVDGGRDLTSSTFSLPDSAPVATAPLGKWSDLLDYVLPVDGANATGASLNYDPDEIAGGHDIDSPSTTFSAPSPPAASELAVTPFEEWGGLNGDEIGVNGTSAEGSVLVGQMG